MNVADSSNKPAAVSQEAAAKQRHRFIALADVSMTRQEAEERVLASVRKYVPSASKSQLKKHPFTFTPAGGKPQSLVFADLVESTRRTGVVPDLDRDLWRKTDPHGTIGLAFNGNLGFQVSAGPMTSKTLNSPGYITNSVLPDLLEEILFHRGETARLSAISEDSFKPCFRAYRAYLSSCITALDAFLNHRQWFTLNDPAKKLSVDDEKILRQRGNLDDKFKKWIPLMTAGKTVDTASPAWLDYQKIRAARNGYVHSNVPNYVFSTAEAAADLNLCRLGVGQLLLETVSLFGTNPLPALLAVRHAPVADFVPVDRSAA